MRSALSLFLTIALMATFPAIAEEISPIGKWKTIDDKTGKPKSIVEIRAGSDGTLYGTIREVLQSDSGPNPICTRCDGERKNKPIQGMDILWGVKPIERGRWGRGKILDPKSGTIYSVELRPKNSGKALEVKGYVGIPALGRKQIWIRASD